MSTFARRRWTNARFPLEICEFIIGFMHPSPTWSKDDDRRRDLYSCLLVCRDWVPKSRIELYRYVRLDNNRRAISFMETIKVFPSLGEFVRGLFFDGGLHAQCRNWFYKVHQDLPSQLPNLVILEYRQLPVVHPVFFALPLRFHSIRCLRLLYLRSWSLRETVRLISRFPQLEELVIDMCDWGQNIPSSVYCRETNGHNAQNHVAPRLELREGLRDKANGYGVVVGWFSKSHLSFSLRSIKLEINLTTSENLHNLLYQCSGTLESVQLEIFGCEDNSGMTWMPAISICTKLRDFGCKLNITFQGNPALRGPFSKRLLRFFESLSSLPSSLRNISLDFPTGELLLHVYTSDVASEIWEAFDSSLGCPKFSHLTCVELIWSTWQFADTFCADYLYNLIDMGVFARYIPKLYGSGILWCGRNVGSLVRRVYPISASSSALAARDRMAWKSSSRPPLFPSSMY